MLPGWEYNLFGYTLHSMIWWHLNEKQGCHAGNIIRSFPRYAVNVKISGYTLYASACFGYYGMCHRTR